MQPKICEGNPKTQILYDANLTNLEEINQFWECISRLAEGNFKDTKKLKNFSYYGRPVYRAKANDTNRLCYTFTPALCILATTPHKYEQLKRRFSTKKSLKNELPSLEILELPDDSSPKISQTGELQFTAVVPFKESMLEWDEVQREAHSQEGSILFRGSPGAGKTLVVIHSMLRFLSDLAQPDPEKPLDESLFMAPFGLIKTLQEEYVKSGLEHKVRFTCWDDYLASFYPIGTKPTTEEDFRSWLGGVKNESWLKSQDLGEIHYELSLIAALGSEEYVKLGKRQSYFANNNNIQTKLISILARWQQHLQDFKTFDPMVSVPKDRPVFLKKYCDETQNLPPTALAYLVGLPGDCIASLDSDQCLDSSPFIDNFLKGLFNLRYGKEYKEFLLEDSYRNPPEVIAVDASVLQFKRKRDTIGYRQVNKNPQSKRPKNSGLMSFVDKKHTEELKPICQSATTVVIVIANAVSDQLRAKINRELGINNIITAKDVIGLEFENVILYEPVSQSSIKGCASVGISLRQSKDLSAVHVALTRSEKNVYILDDEALKRWPTLTEELFGKYLPFNKFAQGEIKSSNKAFEALALNLYEKGQIGNAKEILRFNLQYDEIQIQEFMANARAKAAQALSAPQKSMPAKDSTPKTTLLKQVNDYLDRKQPEIATQIMREQLGFTETMIQTILKSKEDSQSAPAPKNLVTKLEDEKAQASKTFTICMTPEQIQRSQKLWKNFTKKNLQSEMAKPDCPVILFEAPPEIFSLCLKDSRKWKILRSVIDEVNPEVAEKLLSVIVTKTVPAANLVGVKPTEEISMIKYFMLRDKSMKYTIIHILFEKLSPSQKVAFLVDSQAYSGLKLNDDNACFKDDPRTLPLIPDNNAIQSDSKALITLLCKPVKYFNCSSYASALAGYMSGSNLILQLLDDVDLFEFITTNLYNIDSFDVTTVSSIFEGLCSHPRGIYLLNRIYELAPTFKSKITMAILNSSRMGIDPVICNLYKIPLAHTLLNSITTKELAAGYPHGLPDSFVNLLLLSSSEEGIKVIQKMMDAQPSMVNLMTGTVLSFTGYNKCSILPLLSVYEAGISILHQVLDVHRENFVKELANGLIHKPINSYLQLTVYKQLQKSEEGKRFLERLEGFGWNSTANQNPFGFFATQPVLLVNLLLEYIASNRTEKVRELVSAKPSLLLQNGRIEKDKLTFENMRPIDLCQMYQNSMLEKVMMDCLNDSEEGQNVKKALLASENGFKFY